MGWNLGFPGTIEKLEDRAKRVQCPTPAEQKDYDDNILPVILARLGQVAKNPDGSTVYAMLQCSGHLDPMNGQIQLNISISKLFLEQ
jgi:hypothetical protein